MTIRPSGSLSLDDISTPLLGGLKILSDKRLLVKERDWQTGVVSTRELYTVKGDKLIIPLAYALTNNLASSFDDLREDTRFTNPLPKAPDLNHAKASEQQRKAVPELLSAIDSGKTRFILKMAVGTGKTSIPFHLMAKHRLRTLIVVDRLTLANQFIKFGKEECGIDVGFIGAGEFREGEHCTVAMVQTLMNREEPLKGYGLCVVDEADAMVASKMAHSMQACWAKYYIAMSATASPFKLPILMAYCGEHIIETENKPQPATVKVVRFNYDKRVNEYVSKYIIPTNKRRVKYLAKLAKELHDKGRNVLVCGSAVKLLDSFYEEFTCLKPEVSILKLYDAKKNKIANNAQTANQDTSFVMGSYAAITRGLSIDHLDTLITLDMVTNLDQLTGRVRRPCVGKPEGLIYYVVDKGCYPPNEAIQMRKLSNLVSVDKSITLDKDDIEVNMKDGGNDFSFNVYC